MIIEKEKKQRVEEWLGTGTVTAIAECFLRSKEHLNALSQQKHWSFFLLFSFSFLFYWHEKLGNCEWCLRWQWERLEKVGSVCEKARISHIVRVQGERNRMWKVRFVLWWVPRFYKLRRRQDGCLPRGASVIAVFAGSGTALN